MMTIPHRPSLALAAVALAALSACAPPAGPSPPSPVSEGRQARGQRCVASASPVQLPPADALVDAAFPADAERLWASAGRPAGHVLFSIGHGNDGAQVRRAVIESTVPAALADSLQHLVFAHRRKTAPAPAEWGVRLRVGFGSAVALDVARRTECAPLPRQEERLATDVYDVREPKGSPSLRASSQYGAWVRVRVDESGRVTEAVVERGVQRGDYERRLLNRVRAMTFYPALEDGFAVPGETTISIRM